MEVTRVEEGLYEVTNRDTTIFVQVTVIEVVVDVITGGYPDPEWGVQRGYECTSIDYAHFEDEEVKLTSDVRKQIMNIINEQLSWES